MTRLSRTCTGIYRLVSYQDPLAFITGARDIEGPSSPSKDELQQIEVRLDKFTVRNAR